MEKFYKEWLRKNAEEDKRGLAQLQNEPKKPINLRQEPSTSQILPSTIQSNTSQRAQSPQPSTSRGIQPSHSLTTAPTPKTTTDIVFERDGLQLLVERGIFQRQKKFSLQVAKYNKCSFELLTYIGVVLLKGYYFQKLHLFIYLIRIISSISKFDK